MFSKLIELAGLALISLAISVLWCPAGGMLVGGCALLLVGSTTDDAQVGRAFRAGARGVGRAYRRQVARDNGELYEESEFVACPCGGDLDCVVCDGAGVVPNPARRPKAGPHPEISVDPVTQELAERLAKQRRRRGDGRMREATP